MGPRSEKLVFNYVLNFRRVTHFQLCLLETQVTSKAVQYSTVHYITLYYSTVQIMYSTL